MRTTKWLTPLAAMASSAARFSSRHRVRPVRRADPVHCSPPKSIDQADRPAWRARGSLTGRQLQLARRRAPNLLGSRRRGRSHVPRAQSREQAYVAAPHWRPQLRQIGTTLRTQGDPRFARRQSRHRRVTQVAQNITTRSPACTDDKNRIPYTCCSHTANQRSSLPRCTSIPNNELVMIERLRRVRDPLRPRPARPRPLMWDSLATHR